MPLSIFQHESLFHFREATGAADGFGHTFGGTPSPDERVHLLYGLNQADPAIGQIVPGLKWLPLVYHFSYASYDGKLIYCVRNHTSIELLAPAAAEYDPDFPYSNYPRSFPKCPVSFRKQPYDPTVAEDALALAAVFGLDRLSASEMKRAVTISEETSRTISEFSGPPDWSPEEIVRYEHREPFMQGAPLKSCDNPQCTAEIAYRTDKMTIPMDENYKRLTGESSLTLEARDIRRDSMRVFALFQPDENDRIIWGDPFIQLIFEVCECCHCIRVSNQCG